MHHQQQRPSRAQRAAARSPRRDIVRSVSISGRPSRRLLEAIAPFGLALTRRPRRVARVATRRRLARACTRLAGVVAITGASGSGKSTLLREIARALRVPRAARVMHEQRARAERRTVIDALAAPLPRALRAR